MVPRGSQGPGRDHPEKPRDAAGTIPVSLGDHLGISDSGAHTLSSGDSINGVTEFAKYPSIPWNTQTYAGVYASRYPLGIQGIRCLTLGHSQDSARRRHSRIPGVPSVISKAKSHKPAARSVPSRVQEFQFGIAPTMFFSVAQLTWRKQAWSVALSFCRRKRVNHLRALRKTFSLSVGLRISAEEKQKKFVAQPPSIVAPAGGGTTKARATQEHFRSKWCTINVCA